jgi:hypothetical protein
MDRLKHPSTIANLPAYSDPGGAAGYFVDENLDLGQEGTVVTAHHLNALTEEIRNTIVAAGITPDRISMNQLAAAVAAIAATAATNRLPAGTRMLFAQASAPTGWTQITDATADNRMLRVVAGTGGGVGGSHSPILMDVVPSHIHALGGSVTVSSESHAHEYGLNRIDKDALTGSGQAYAVGNTPGNWDVNATNDTTSVAHAHTVGGSVDANSGSSNWTPRYVDLILAEAG